MIENDSRTTVAALCRRAERIGRRIAERDLAGRPLYVVAQSEAVDVFGRSEACDGYTSPRLDLYLRTVIGPRWRGRGPCVVVNDLVLREDCGEFWEPFFLATFLHELAHVVERPEPAPVSVPTEPQRLRFEALVLADATARPVARPDDVRPVAAFDPAHGPRFLRAALHLRHRAARHGVRVGPGLVFDARSRGLSRVNAYRAALGDEPVRMARAAIRDVLAAPSPEPFARLWADDLEALSRKENP